MQLFSTQIPQTFPKPCETSATQVYHAMDDDYRMELADEESNSMISVQKKPKKKLKVIDKRSLSCLVLSERCLDDRVRGRIV